MRGERVRRALRGTRNVPEAGAEADAAPAGRCSPAPRLLAERRDRPERGVLGPQSSSFASLEPAARTGTDSTQARCWHTRKVGEFPSGTGAVKFLPQRITGVGK